MRDRELHSIEEYLSEDWIAEWAREVVGDVEAYLAKHAAFDAYSDGNQPT